MRHRDEYTRWRIRPWSQSSSISRRSLPCIRSLPRAPGARSAADPHRRRRAFPPFGKIGSTAAAPGCMIHSRTASLPFGSRTVSRRTCSSVPSKIFSQASFVSTRSSYIIMFPFICVTMECPQLPFSGTARSRSPPRGTDADRQHLLRRRSTLLEWKAVI